MVVRYSSATKPFLFITPSPSLSLFDSPFWRSGGDSSSGSPIASFFLPRRSSMPSTSEALRSRLQARGIPVDIDVGSTWPKLRGNHKRGESFGNGGGASGGSSSQNGGGRELGERGRSFSGRRRSRSTSTSMNAKPKSSDSFMGSGGGRSHGESTRGRADSRNGGSDGRGSGGVLPRAIDSGKQAFKKAAAVAAASTGGALNIGGGGGGDTGGRGLARVLRGGGGGGGGGEGKSRRGSALSQGDDEEEAGEGFGFDRIGSLGGARGDDDADAGGKQPPFMSITIGGVSGYLPDVHWSVQMQQKRFLKVEDSGTVK